MKYLVVLALLQTVSFNHAMPQEGSLLQRLLSSDKNPCGAGVTPNCRCASDLDVAPQAAYDCPAGHKDLQCFCPETNEELDLDAIKEIIKEALVDSPRNPCGAGNEMTCVCDNGDEAVFGAGPPCGVSRTKEVRLPTCTCPDGKAVENIGEMVERLRKVFNFENHIGQESILSRIHKSDRNPCGAGISPSCSCKSDKSLPKEFGACPLGLPDVACVCPNGNEVNVENIVEMVRNILNKHPRNPCGIGNRISCFCENGEEAGFAPNNHCPENKLPSTCSCPDGTKLESIKMLVENADMQFLLRGNNHYHDHEHVHDHEHDHEHDQDEDE